MTAFGSYIGIKLFLLFWHKIFYGKIANYAIFNRFMLKMTDRMNNARKKVLFVAGGFIGLTVAVLLYLNVVSNQNKKGIPEISDTSSLSLVVEEQISEAFKKARRKPTAKNLGELGLVYHSSTNYNQAVQCYQLATEKNKSDWKWYYYLGSIYLELGEAGKAVENFNRVTEINPDVSLAWYYLGEAYRNLRQNDLSENAFGKITNKTNIPEGKAATRFDNFPLGIYAMFQLSKIYFETERLDLAEETLKTLINTNELYGPAYRLLGNVYSTKGDVAAGEKFTVMANDLLPFSPPVDTLADKLTLLSRSELYLLKKIDEATNNAYTAWSLTLVEHGLKYIPENQNLVSKAIEIYLWNNQTQKASELAEHTLSSYIDNYDELGLVGMRFFKRGFYNEAEKYLAKAWKLKPEDYELFISLAYCYGNTGEKPKAEELLTQAAETNPDNAENLAGITYTFIRIENYEKAAYYLNRLKQIAPDNPRVQKISGKIAESNGDLMTAISWYELSFKGNPKDVETINSLGDLLIGKELWHRFYHFYKEVIRQNPNHPEFLEKWGTFYLACPERSLRNIDESIAYSKRAFIHISSPPNIVLSAGKNLAVAYLIKRDKENALNAVNKTISYAQRNNAPQNVKQELEKLRNEIQGL
jgi:tetratricopeptide (TPR) repeat protein